MTSPALTHDTEGVFFDLPANAYHCAPGVSSTMLRLLARSPAHMQAALQEARDTAALTFGRVVHQLALEPEAPIWWVVPPEDIDLRTKAGKEWRIANEGKKVIRREEWEAISGVLASLKSNLLVDAELAAGQKEVSVFKQFRCESGSVLRRGRIDLVGRGGTLADIKTCEDASPQAFARHIHAMGYHLQAAYYLDLWNEANPGDPKRAFVFIAVEKSPPYAVALYHLSDAAIALGRSRYIELLKLYMRCRDERSWPAYSLGVEAIDLPAYAYPREARLQTH